MLILQYCFAREVIVVVGDTYHHDQVMLSLRLSALPCYLFSDAGWPILHVAPVYGYFYGVQLHEISLCGKNLVSFHKLVCADPDLKRETSNI